MPIKAIKLRAGLLLLLFTLMFISSNFLITEIHADTLEEPFKNTPLPFWEIDNTNCLTQYGTNTQDILFNYGEYLEDFNDISDWEMQNPEPETETYSENGLLVFHITNTDSDDLIQRIFSDINDLPYPYFYVEYKYYFTNNDNVDYILLGLHQEDNADAGSYRYNQQSLPDAESWTISKKHIQQFGGVYQGPYRAILIDVKTDNPCDTYLYVEYIHIWRDYQEDMSDISDWTYDSSAGLAGGEYGFGTNGYIGEIWIITDGAEDEYVMYKTPMNYLITSFTRVKIMCKIENSVITLSLRITGIGLDSYFTSMASTNWGLLTPDITGQADKTIEWLYIKVDDIPDDGYVGNYSAYFDYVQIWEVGGSLNVSIPVEQFKNHKFEFMVDADDLTEYSKLDFGIFQNYEEMNYDFSLENNSFIQRDFTYNYSAYNYLRFKLDLKYSTNFFKISCYDENNSKLFDNIIYEYVRKTGNQFIISSENFTGWFHLYYFTGNVDYSTIWSETIIEQDPNIENYLLSASALDDDLLTSHEIIYNRFVTNFQFMRSNMLLYTEISTIQAKQLGVKIEIQFYYPDGTKFYRVEGIFKRYSIDMVFEVKIYENDLEIYSASCGNYETGETQEGIVKFAVWRTQDNHLGMFFEGDDFLSFDYGAPRFVSNKTFENFQANLTITYFSDDFNTGYQNFMLELSGFELGYGGVDGVAEPHFSSTWWDAIPILGPIITAFMLIASTIIFAIEIGLLPITTFLDSIFGAIGGVAGIVWGLFEGALSDLGISVDAIASDVFGFFDTILGSIFDIIDNVYTAIINLNDNFIAWVVTGITNALVPAIIAGLEDIIDFMLTLWEYQLNLFGNALGWGDIGTFLFDFTDSVVLIVPSWLTFIVGIMSFLVSILVWVNMMWAKYGAMIITMGTLFVALDFTNALLTMDDEKIVDCIGKYLNVLEKILTFTYNIISAVLSAIWGILPF